MTEQDQRINDLLMQPLEEEEQLEPELPRFPTGEEIQKMTRLKPCNNCTHPQSSHHRKNECTDENCNCPIWTPLDSQVNEKLDALFRLSHYGGLSGEVAATLWYAENQDGYHKEGSERLRDLFESYRADDLI